jgi:hypothetical protein
LRNLWSRRHARFLAISQQDDPSHEPRVCIVTQLVRQVVERLLIRVAHDRGGAGDPLIDALGCGMKQQRGDEQHGCGHELHPRATRMTVRLKPDPTYVTVDGSLSQLRRRRGRAICAQSLFDSLVVDHLILASSAARILSIA